MRFITLFGIADYWFVFIYEDFRRVYHPLLGTFSFAFIHLYTLISNQNNSCADGQYLHCGQRNILQFFMITLKSIVTVVEQ